MSRRSMRLSTFSTLSSTDGLFFLYPGIFNGGRCGTKRRAGQYIPVDVKHDRHRRGEKRWQHLQPAQDSVLGIWPPIHVMGEHGRKTDPHGESQWMEVHS